MVKNRKNNTVHIKKSKKRRLPLSAYLSYLIIITLILTAVSLARYTAASVDDESARVAVFSVSATSRTDKDTPLVLNNDEELRGEYIFDVNNDSETSVKYTVIAENLPAGITVSMGSQTFTVTENGSSVSFSPINLGTNTAERKTLIFAALESTESYGPVEISVDVKFEQAS